MKKIIFGVIGLALSVNAASAMNYDAVTRHLTIQQTYESVCNTHDGYIPQAGKYLDLLDKLKGSNGPSAMSDAMTESMLNGAINASKIRERGEEVEFCEMANNVLLTMNTGF